MGFEESLLDGSSGIELRFPEGVALRESGPGWAQFGDTENGVLWQCSFSPFPMGLAPDHDDPMRADLERAARRLFEAVWDQRRQEHGPAPGREAPRTADESWSPIVELERGEVPGGAVLRALHRLAYEPEYEQIAARVLIPVRDGTVEIAAYTADTLTGVRESALIAARTGSADELLENPGQAFFDDPVHDARFPEHALSRARRAQAWLLRESGMRVTRPAAPEGLGLVALRSAKCAITPPPRYREIPAGVLQMADTMVNFGRIDLEADDPELFEVWHMPDATVRAGDPESLRELAVRTCEDWANEGAEDIRVEARTTPAPDSFAEVDCVVRFAVQGRNVVAVQRWISDEGGRVWRLGVSGDASGIEIDEIRSTLADVRASFRPMTPPGPPKSGARRWGRS